MSNQKKDNSRQKEARKIENSQSVVNEGKQQMVDEVMKKVAQMDEEQLTSIHGKIVKASGPKEVEDTLSDIKKGVSSTPKAKAPVAKAPGPLTASAKPEGKAKEVTEVANDAAEGAETEKEKLEAEKEAEDVQPATEGKKSDAEEDKEDSAEESSEEAEDKESEEHEKSESEDEESSAEHAEKGEEESAEEEGDESAEKEEVKEEAAEEGAESKEDEDDDDEEDIEINADEDVDALVKDEEGLTEGFKAKAKTIFEAAVKSKIRSTRAQLHESFKQKLSENTAKVKENLIEQVDAYLTHAVESWVKDNKVAIDSSVRTEIAENFITSLKNVFADSYIDIPVAKKDLVESLNNQVAQLQESVKKATATIAAQKKQNDQLVRKSILEQSSKGLAVTQAVKLKELTKDVVFESAEAFQKKVSTIRESYFSGNKSATTTLTETTSVAKPVSISMGSEVIVEGQEDPLANLPADMKRYVNALSRVERGNPNRKV